MTDEDKAKAEKMAAARKKVEALKKKKKAGAGAAAGAKKDEPEKSPASAAAEATTEEPAAESSTKPSDGAEAADGEEGEDAAPLPSPAQASTSLAQQSKARSTSFRKTSISGPISPGMFSPEGETAPDIYRKHVAKIEELERENKRLAKEAGDAEKRWQKAEEELADLREEDGDAATGKKSGGEDGVVEKLKNELAALQRQNAQLQRGTTNRGHGASPSISMPSPRTLSSATELEAQLASKSSTIETMELEMSRLRAQVERLSVSAATPSDQITALEEKLARAERAAALAQRELADLKRNLERTTEKAVKAGSEAASAETKLRALERDAADATAARDEVARRAEALEKKVATLTTLHKEQDARAQALRREKEAVEKEAAELRAKLERAEHEAHGLRKKDAAEGGGLGDDEAVDELEEEGRRRLEKRVRELEAENSDLRRGIWHERRKEMQVGPEHYQDVDLSPSARRGPAGFGEFLTSGLNALTGAAPGAAGHAHGHAQGPGHAHGHGHAHDHDELLEDDDFEFDEEAYRKAQQEEAMKRIERVREIKRQLKNWEGWRLDLVESRRGGGEGIGEIFEV